MSPWLSIVVPVHNVAGYLPACIDSILERDRDGIELVLVDDCSTDESGAICDRYSGSSPDVRVIHLSTNQGVAQARNHGLAAARGDYVLFVDGDDYLVSGWLARLKQEMDRLGPIDLVICRYGSESKVLSNAAMFPCEAAGRKLDAAVVLQHLTAIDFYLDHCWPYLISRALIERHGVRFKRFMVAEDAEFIVRILTLASSAAYSDDELYCYRERDGSLKNHKGAAPTASFLLAADAMRQTMENVAATRVQREFAASQIRHSLGVFAARLCLLDDAEAASISTMVGPEQLPPDMRRSCSRGVAETLIAYRDSVDAATLTLASPAKRKPVFIYCAGPSAEAVIRVLCGAQYDVRAVIDDNAAFNGRTLRDVPIADASYLQTLSASERAQAFIVVCTQKLTASRRIIASLEARGFAPAQIAHRRF